MGETSCQDQKWNSDILKSPHPFHIDNSQARKKIKSLTMLDDTVVEHPYLLKSLVSDTKEGT